MKTREWLLITLLICCVSLAVFTCDDGSSTSSEQADDDDNNDSDNPFDDDDNDDNNDSTDDDDDETEENFALSYSGYDQCTLINHADSLSIVNNALTVEAWIFPLEYDSSHYNSIVTKLSFEDYLHHGWSLDLIDGKLSFYVHGCGVIESRDVISMTKWTHVAGTCDGREISIWIDGVHAGLYLTTRCQIDDSNGDMMIGSGRECDWHNFNGLIDEVRISGEALYYDDFTPEETMPVGEETMALLHFNEGEGETAYDAGEHDNDGTIYRATWVERE